MERSLGLLPFDGIPNGPYQDLAAVLPLYQVVLHPALDGDEGGRLIVQAAQHDERDIGGGLVEFADCVKAGTVRQAQIGQDDVESVGLEQLFGSFQVTGRFLN